MRAGQRFRNRNRLTGRAISGKLGMVVFLCAFLGAFWYGAGRAAAFVQELSAGSQRVFDYAGLFSQTEAEALEEKTAQLREKRRIEAVVLTAEDAEGKSAASVADRFYFDNGFSEAFYENGVLVLIDMDNRELYLGTYGSVIRILTDERVDSILDDMYESASRGDFAAAAMAGLEGTEAYLDKGIASGQYNYDTETGKISVHRSIRWYEALFALAVSGISAGGVCMSVVKRYGMKEDRGSNYHLAYRADCRFRFQNPEDRLLNTTVTHMVIPRQPPRNGGGMSKGGSSSGRSSTHSCGNHQAGGGGRKF